MSTFSSPPPRDPLGRHHHAEIDHLVVVAPSTTPTMFLPMSWTSPFTVASTTLPLSRGRAARSLLRLHVRLEVRDGALHHARALHDLRQEHFPGAEEVADDFIPFISGPSITLSGWSARCRASSVSSSMNSTMPARARARAASRRAPRATRVRPRASSPRLDALGELDQPLGRVGAAIEECPRRARAARVGMSSYTPSCPALTMPMSSPARIAW